MAGRPIIAAASWVFLAAGILFQFFVVLSGGVSGSPEPKFWFLAADTRGIGNAPAAAAWSFFSVCDITGLSGTATTFGCRGAQAALPFDPVRNFATGANTAGVPPKLLGTSHYYYLSRASVGFQYVALFFSVVSLLVGLVALCTRLGSYLASVAVFLAFAFQALSTSLMTAWVVQGRSAFRSAGRSAVIGRYSMGFTWAAVAAFLLSMVMFCVGGAVGKNKSKTPKSRFGLFGRKRSTRSRGSFYGSDPDSGRVKDDYA